MNVTDSERKKKFERLERAIQQAEAQSALSSLLLKYKVDNGAIMHLAIFGMDGTLLAKSPDEEVQNKSILEAQYDWLSETIGPAIKSMSDACDRFANNSKRRVAKDFGRPKILRMQTENGETVSQIYVSPIDPRSFIFAVVSSRAPTRRNAFVVNEALLLEDLANLIKDVLDFNDIKQILVDTRPLNVVKTSS